MVPVLSLWLSILSSTIAVFLASSLIHMVLGYHKNDFRALPNEEAVLTDLHRHNISPGEYMFPRAQSMAEMKSEGFMARWKRGPVGLLTVFPNERFTMAPQLAAWLVYCLAMSVLVAYVTGHAVAPAADYMTVFRLASTTAFIAYGAAIWQQTIWYRHSMSTTLKQTFDAVIYALVTAALFGWLWP